MIYSEFAEFLAHIERTPSRNDMTLALVEFLPKLNLTEVPKVLYLMQGRLVPQFVDLEFSMSRKLVTKLFQTKVIEDEERADKLFAKHGDLGLVAEELLAENKSADLQIEEVYQILDRIARYEGKGSQELKLNDLYALLQKVSGIEARYIVRTVIGKLRLGLSDKTILDALSWIKVEDKSLRKDLDSAYGAKADLGELTVLVLQTEALELEEKLAQIHITPGVPVSAKLVEREKSPLAVFERTGPVLVQPKLDGLRAQIHLESNGDTHVFSRNMENLTDMFPDICQAVKQLGVRSIVIDSEAIGYDFENEIYLPFQETMQRRRKHDVAEMADSIPVKAMAFDVLHLDGEDMSKLPLEQRVGKLAQLIANSKQSVIELLDSPKMETEAELESYFLDKVGAGLEGIIVKQLGTTYDPGTRNYDWIKLKANTQSELVDTVDVVVLGYYHGRGARAKFGMGALLVGVYDADDGKYYSVAKVGTGMTDADWEMIAKDLSELKLKVPRDDVVVAKQLRPDVWVVPQIVMEVDADEITRSPAHLAAQNLKASFEKELSGKGLSLRFPRLKVWDRDKSPEQTTSSQELIKLFELRRSS